MALRLNLFLVISVSLFWQVNGQERSALPEYPSLRKIAEVFTRTYDIEDYQSDDFYRFRFIKDPSGWYVVPEYFSGKKPIRLDLWNAGNGFPEHIIPDKQGKQIMLSDLISNSDLYDYSIHPYFGYPGWKDDVIEDFQNRSLDSLSDNQLYGLARAFSEKASDIFWPHSMYPDISSVRGEDVKRRDIRNFLDLSRKAIEKYTFLHERSPAFETKVGLMDVKLSNEVMSKYYELKLFGFEDEAESLLNEFGADSLYDTFWKEYARQTLSQARPNSIIFSNGDNDTYPLLWVQEVENLREDVMIINLSLLNDPQYTKLLSGGYLDAPPVKIGFTDPQLDIITKSVILVDPQAEDMPDPNFRWLEKFIILKSGDPSGIIPIDTGLNEIRFLTREGLFDTLVIKNGMPGNVLSTAELVVRSLLNYQLGKRNIYFTKGMQEKYSNMVENEELTDLGLLYELIHKSENTISFNNQYYDTTRLGRLSRQKGLSLKDPSYYARAMIYNLVMEAQLMLILMDKDLESTYTRLSEFVREHPADSTGINFYYLFAVSELHKNQQFQESAINHFRDFISLLGKKINETELSDDNFRDLGQLKFYQSIIAGIKQHEKLVMDSGTSDNLIEMENTIYNRLMEFPEINVK